MAGAKGTPQQLPLSLRDYSKEIWRSVVGYAGLYEVSNLGRVRSVDRFVRGPLVERRQLRGRMLTVRLVHVNARSKGRYPMVDLSKENHRAQPYIHALVLEAFVGPRPPGYVCNHKDGDSENNSVENLEWVTQSANVLHAQANGLLRQARGEQVPHKLTATQVLTIRRLSKEGSTRAALAREFGVTASTISAIVLRLKWASLPEE